MLAGVVLARMLLAARAEGRLGAVSVRLSITGLVVYTLITVGGQLAAAGSSGLPESGIRPLESGYGAPLGSAPWMLWIPTPHSGNPADMLRTVAGACFVIGLLVAVFDCRRAPRGLVLESVRAAGAAPLTIYTTHVITTGILHHVALNAADSGMMPWYGRGSVIFLVQLAGVLLIGLCLALLRRRGPLETFLGWVSGVGREPRTA